MFGAGTVEIRTEDVEGNIISSKVSVRYTNEYDQIDCAWLEESAPGAFTCDEDLADATDLVIVTPQAPGYWASCARECEDGPIICESLVTSDDTSWWHALLGPYQNVGDRGRGIKIGVVDASFSHTDGLTHVLPAGSPTHEATSTFWSHGEVVCRILSDLSAPGCCAPIAPGASVIFLSGSFARQVVQDRFFVAPGGSDDVSGDLDPSRVASAIVALAAEHEVDLINLSLGTFRRMGAQSGLERAIDFARSRGVALICAAGNEHVEDAAFPASLPACISVGAFGRRQWGPDTSIARFLSDTAAVLGEIQSQKIFYSPESAYGAKVDTVAPGVGIFVSRNGRTAFDVTGTSFAAPILTGLLAVDLARDSFYLSMSRDENRSIYVEQRLRDLCTTGAFASGWGGVGIATLS